MKALTLHQPWASMVAIGDKQIETRAWRTDYRGLVAIHAGKAFPEYARAFALTSRFVRARHQDLALLSGRIPLRAVVAVAELVDIDRITEDLTRSISGLEVGLGNYEPGRWAWRLAHVRPLATPYGMPGARGLWDVSSYEAEQILAALSPA